MTKNLATTMSELVNEHKRTYDDNTLRNLTDVYLKKIKESNDPKFNGIGIFHKSAIFRKDNSIYFYN